MGEQERIELIRKALTASRVTMVPSNNPAIRETPEGWYYQLPGSEEWHGPFQTRELAELDESGQQDRVEYVKDRARTLAEAALDFECPTCGANAKAHCHTVGAVTRRMRTAHRERIKLAFNLLFEKKVV